MRKLLSATAAAALVTSSITPAYATTRYGMEPVNAPEGLSALVNLKVPLGVSSPKAKKASYGLAFGYGHRVGDANMERGFTVREAKLADIRFTDSFKLQKAQVATFDLANLDQDQRLNLTGEGDNTLWIVVGLVAAGVAVCLLADCFDGDDNDDDEESE